MKLSQYVRIKRNYRYQIFYFREVLTKTQKKWKKDRPYTKTPQNIILYYIIQEGKGKPKQY